MTDRDVMRSFIRRLQIKTNLSLPEIIVGDQWLKHSSHEISLQNVSLSESKYMRKLFTDKVGQAVGFVHSM